MVVSRTDAVPADVSAQNVVAAHGHHDAMLQQNMWDAHGHEMHPQQFVRLVGCHDAKAGHHEAAPA